MWKETGTTVLFVTHNIAEAVNLATRVIALAKNPEAEGSHVALDLTTSQHDIACRLAEATGHSNLDS